MPPPANPQQALAVSAGGRDLKLGYTQDQVQRAGGVFTRLSFPLLVTPLVPGAIAVPPAKVVARLQTGMGRDAFGFPAARSGLFRASDVPRTLEVRPLPERGKPPSFAGAI